MTLVKTTIHPAQCRAARAALGWSQEDLATAANVARATVADFEREARVPVPNNLVGIKTALEQAGIKFTQDDSSYLSIRFKL